MDGALHSNVRDEIHAMRLTKFFEGCPTPRFSSPAQRGRGTTPPGPAEGRPEDKLRVVEGALAAHAPSVTPLCGAPPPPRDAQGRRSRATEGWRKTKPIAFALILAALVLGTAPGLTPTARAQPVEVDINKGTIQALPIAIPAFSGTDPKTTDIGAQIAQVISADLGRSGFFRPLDPATFAEKSLNVNINPDFPVWKQISAQALIDGQASLDADGRLRVVFRLWDVFNGTQLIGTELTAAPDTYRRIAHKIADAVYKRMTGEDGYFDTRIVFVAEAGPKTHRVKRLAIMDQDGFNPYYLTSGAHVIMTPRFASNDQEITYSDLSRDAAKVYVFNIETGRSELVGKFADAMAFASRFSPDGSKIALTVERNGDSNLYLVDLHTGATRKLTSDRAINTSPSFSPDGSKIVFNSDRGGSPQIYIMNADGSNIHRISFGNGRYTTPVWSPKGDLIAATRQNGNTFHITVMNPDGSGERVITSSFLDEGPTWAPNGRVLMFSRETPGAGQRLWTVDVSGRNEHEVPYPGGATDPAWSPLLK
jgi:TolB protein